MTVLTRREKWFSGPLLKWVRKLLPRMSLTEKEALEAGTVGFDGELMRGNPDFSKLFAYPSSQLTDEEQAFLDGPCNRLCELIDDWNITFVERDIPKVVWDYIKAEGFLGLIIPKEYGGKGFSAAANSEIVMKVSSRGPSAAVALIVPNSLGPGELLMLYGTQAQKDMYLPRLSSGKEVPAFGLTSVTAGSDATSMTDEGIVCWGTYKGKKTLGMRVNWAKRYISLGPVCTLLGLAFKLRDPDHLLGENEDIGITLALIPTDTKGVSIGRRHYPAGQAFPNGPNWGEDVFVPMDWVIGGQDRVGEGWKMLITALAAGRGIMLPAMSVAGMKVSSFSSGAYSRIREQFNLPIARFEGVQEALGRIAGDTYKLDAARRLTLQMLDAGEKPAVISAIMKYHATEGMRKAVNDAMDVHSGKTVIDGPRNYLGSTYKAIPIAIAVEGANIMTRSLMIYGQGSIRCHPYIQAEIEAAQLEDHEAGVKAFDPLLMKHMKYTCMTFIRAVGRGWTFGLFSRSPVGGSVGRYYRQVKRISAALALMSEVSLVVLGGKLKRKEFLSARLGDVLSELYLVCAALKRFKDNGDDGEEYPLVTYAAQSSLHRAETALWGAIKNFPVRPVGWLMRILVMPFGVLSQAPSDEILAKCSGLITEPTKVRTRLCESVYRGDKSELGKLEKTFTSLVALEPVRSKMRKQRIYDVDEALDRGLISEKEGEALREVFLAVREVLEVDHFAPEELMGGSKTF